MSVTGIRWALAFFILGTIAGSVLYCVSGKVTFAFVWPIVSAVLFVPLLRREFREHSAQHDGPTEH